MIYFTSDLHLGQKGINYVHQRPFDDVNDMNEAIIENYNRIVTDEDTVYIIGDLCNGISVAQSNELIARLNGKKILIRGNHDKQYDESLFEEICDYKYFFYRGFTFVLMHYPIMDWFKRSKGSIHIHGHLHSDRRYNLSNRKKGIRRYDCGVDANSYAPVSILQIMHFYQKFDAYHRNNNEY